MSWTPPPRGADVRALYDAAEQDRAARPERYRLDPALVIARATRDGEIPTSRFPDGWRDGLGAYLASAEEDGRLNALGLRMVRDAATGRLVAGTRIADAFDADPSLDRPLAPPIVIVGGWRTGTTFLFRLLGTDPRLHAPLPAELSAPWRFAGADHASREKLIDAAAGAHDLLHVLNPTMAAVHPSGARLAEECVLAMGTDLRNWGFTSTVRLDGYANWLAQQDLGASYRLYRRALKLLASGDDRRFVLKAPAHTAELRHLAAAFPGAVVVHLHRDIVETVASGASLFAVFRATYSDHVDPLDVGRFQTEQTELWLRRAKAFRDGPASAAATFVDVAYADLVADPPAVLARIYAAASMEPPADVRGFVDAYHAAQPRDRHGRHAYSAADFGLDPAELRERFVFLG